MSRENLRSVFHLKAGGGTRHKITICIMAVVAAEHGFHVVDNSKWIPQQGDELPDLVIRKEDTIRYGEHGERRSKKVLSWAIEIVDTHEPIRKERWGGYEDTIFVHIKKAEELCLTEVDDYVGFHAARPIIPHPLCLDSLIRLCERSLP